MSKAKTPTDYIWAVEYNGKDIRVTAPTEAEAAAKAARELKEHQVDVILWGKFCRICKASAAVH